MQKIRHHGPDDTRTKYDMALVKSMVFRHRYPKTRCNVIGLFICRAARHINADDDTVHRHAG